jgi:Nif-specific regulatory protein
MARDGASRMTESSQITRERDLYLRLLQLSGQAELEPMLRQALQLVVELTHARQGYLEIQDDDSRLEGPRWWIASGFSDAEVATVRAAISRGIIAESLATGKAVITASAFLDPRFNARESVRSTKIEAVLCVPIGEDPPCGVLYLQGRIVPGPFGEEDSARAELFARHLAPLVDRLLAAQRQREANDPTRPWRQRLRTEGIVGHSQALADLLQQVVLIAPLDVSALLLGESGSGKSMIAKLIHDNSPRAHGPFLDLNCAALPETLIESELFGALPGAHSTATRRITGKVAAADGGTLLLDEVSELSVPAQAKLLQLLHSREYYPLGASTPSRADVRILAASNIDLSAAVAARRFREDLFFRLQVVPIHVPSLQARREDIRELALHFAALACERHSLKALPLARSALRAVEETAWPGNVRQLAHSIEAAAIRAAGSGATQIERIHIFPDRPRTPDETNDLTFQEATRRFHEQLLRDTLDATSWNVVETARRLDLTRSHVYNLIRAFGLERSKS